MSQSGLILPLRVPGGAVSMTVLPRFVAAADLYWRDSALAFGVDFTSSRRDLVTGGQPTAASVIGGNTALGPGLTADATRTGLAYAQPPLIPATAATATYVIVWKPSNATTGTEVFIMAMGLSGDPFLGLFQNTTTLAYGFADNGVTPAANNSMVLGQTAVLIAVKNGTSRALYVDGVRLISDSSGNATKAAGALGIGRQGSATTSHASGTASMAMVFNRALTQNEVVDLTSRLRRAIPDTERFRPAYFAPSSTFQTFTYAGSGGLHSGGAAPVQVLFVPRPTGGLQSGGHAPLQFVAIPKPSGGLQSGGTSPASFTKVYLPTGGLVSGGHGPVQFIAVFRPTGGLQSGGHAPVAILAVVQPTGGLHSGGAAPRLFIAFPKTSGGLNSGGAAFTAFVPAGGVTGVLQMISALQRLGDTT